MIKVNGKKLNKFKIEMSQKELVDLSLKKAAALLKQLSKDKHACKIESAASEDDMKRIYRAHLQRTPYGAVLSIEEN